MTIASTQSAPVAIAVDSSNVYWTNDAYWLDGGSVQYAPLGGGAPTLLASGQNDPDAIAVDSTYVYWSTAGTRVTQYTDGAVRKIPIDGGSISTLASGLSSPGGLVIDLDAGVLYWVEQPPAYTDNYQNGMVVKMSLSTGVVTTLATNQYSPGYLAIDAHSVYWTNQGQVDDLGSVMKLTPR